MAKLNIRSSKTLLFYGDKSKQPLSLEAGRVTSVDVEDVKSLDKADYEIVSKDEAKDVQAA